MDDERWQRGHDAHTRSDMERRQAKRATLTFPIQSSTQSSSSTSHSSTYTSLVAGKSAPTGPTDSAFLTALAAHERRVLELREELIKAEQDLHRLKQTWAAHEAHKKRHDVRKVHKMQALNTAEDTPDAGPLDRHQERERRRSLLNGTRNSTRTVFSGSRHARTLSLLSPDLLRQPPPPRELPRPPLQPRVATDADLTNEVARTADDAIDLGLPREVLLKTGKQMASDFREGLWTFIEDLRQATVGDEGVNGTSSRTQSQQGRPSRPQPSRVGSRTSPNPQGLRRSATVGSTTRTSSRSPACSPVPGDIAYLDIGNSFWKENGLEEPKSANPSVVRKSPKKPVSSDNPRSHRASVGSLEAWDTWDATSAEQNPVRLNGDSTVSDGRGSPNAQDTVDGTSPTTSTSSSRDTKRDSIPWPALNKLAPSNLRRTASHLMNEWEKSLASPIEGERRPDYLGRAISPAGSSKDTKND